MYISIPINYECSECGSQKQPKQWQRMADCGHKEAGKTCIDCGHEKLDRPIFATYTQPFPQVITGGHTVYGTQPQRVKY